jgi:hypothetical protein
LTYDPKAKTIAGKPWWLILVCCDDLARYYRQQYSWFYKSKPQLQKPAWNSHISVLRGEKPQNQNLWGFRNNEVIEFEYEDRLLTNDLYYWLPVKCPELLDIRECLGLPRQGIFNLHLSVGIDITTSKLIGV